MFVKDELKDLYDIISVFFMGPVIKLCQKSMILCYHSFDVSEKNVFIDQSICIDVRVFESQMKWLSTFCDFVSLDELLSGKVLYSEKKKKWNVAITFDDGYKNVLDAGLPIFEKYHIPITWFITTRFVEEPQYLPWWDLLAFVFNSYKGDLKFRVNGKYFFFSLNDPDQRSDFRRELDAFFKDATPSRRDDMVSLILSHLPKEFKSLQNGMIRWKELEEISSHPLVTIGSHTHSHVNSARCTEAEFRDELKRSKEKLEEWTGQEVRFFAYPFGKKRYVKQELSKIVCEEGFSAAFILGYDYYHKKGDRFMIPRMPVDSRWSMNRFKTRICSASFLKWFLS